MVTKTLCDRCTTDGHNVRTYQNINGELVPTGPGDEVDTIDLCAPCVESYYKWFRDDP